MKKIKEGWDNLFEGWCGYSKPKSEEKGGFTLIELLVVITIIGILSTIVVVNLNSTRGKGQDTAIKEQMAQIRTQGALYYDDEYGYSAGAVSAVSGEVNCITSSSGGAQGVFVNTFFADTDFLRSAVGITRNSSVIPTCYLGGSTSSGKAQSWVVFSKMRLGGYWCVDSIGNSNETAAHAATVSGVDYSCPTS